jgi:hypothetical protein
MTKFVAHNVLLKWSEAQGEAMSSELDPKTVETICSLIKDAPERQLDNANTLDNKMVQIFGAAGIVIGLLGLSQNNLGQGLLITVCLLGSLTFYIATAVVAFTHLRPKPFRRSLHGDTLWPNTWHLRNVDVQHTVIADVGKAYSHNKALVIGKAHTLSIAIFTTAMEVVLVGLALILSRLT